MYGSRLLRQHFLLVSDEFTQNQTCTDDLEMFLNYPQWNITNLPIN